MLSFGIWRGTATLSVAAVIAGTFAPLRAQDADGVYAVLLQSWRSQERVAQPEPSVVPRAPRSYSPYILDHRFPQRPRTVREKKRERENIETAKPKAAAPVKAAQIPSNPHLALMTDPTLRRGDMVMFPDGPRVFQGEPGNRHAASDFVPFAKAKGLSKADRKYLMALRTGVNEAWAEGTDDKKLAQNTRDVDSTGSIRTKRNKR
jgi:hypothetical protein